MTTAQFTQVGLAVTLLAPAPVFFTEVGVAVTVTSVNPTTRASFTQVGVQVTIPSVPATPPSTSRGFANIFSNATLNQ